MSERDDNLKSIIDKALGYGLDPGGTFAKMLLSKVVACRACSTKNRIQPANQKPRCGRCGLPLTP